MMKPFHIFLPEQLRKRTKREAKRSGISEGELIRSILNQYFRAGENKTSNETQDWLTR